MKGKTIELTSDKVRVSGPRVDGSFTVSFDVGEYEQAKVAELLRIPQQTVLKVVVKVEE